MHLFFLPFLLINALFVFNFLVDLIILYTAYMLLVQIDKSLIFINIAEYSIHYRLIWSIWYGHKSTRFTYLKIKICS